MRVEEFDFDLPERLIALRPARPRRASRLLVAKGAQTVDSRMEALPDWLAPGDLLVFNDTKVIPARLFGQRRRASADGPGVAKIEAILLKRLGDDLWEALARPAKRLREGDALDFDGLAATVAWMGAGGEVALRFGAAGGALDAAIEAVGHTPLPPYIARKRAADADDRTDYQTIFAEKPGSVAAPTASLHFDAALMAALEARGVGTARLTLHVGAGTFLPVKTATVDGHRMHAEWGEIGAATAAAVEAAKARGGRVIAVGTTAARLLETAARETGEVRPWRGETDIFIAPGFPFRAIDGLITNFHLPRSTLIMLVAAFLGLERTRALYRHAVESEYRFYSYGDASLLLPRS